MVSRTAGVAVYRCISLILSHAILLSACLSGKRLSYYRRQPNTLKAGREESLITFEISTPVMVRTCRDSGFKKRVQTA